MLLQLLMKEGNLVSLIKNRFRMWCPRKVVIGPAGIMFIPGHISVSKGRGTLSQGHDHASGQGGK